MCHHVWVDKKIFFYERRKLQQFLHILLVLCVALRRMLLVSCQLRTLIQIKQRVVIYGILSVAWYRPSIYCMPLTATDVNFRYSICLSRRFSELQSSTLTTQNENIS